MSVNALLLASRFSESHAFLVEISNPVFLVKMISVTAAAHSFRRSSRPVGIHVKAYGSGRVALSAIPEAHIEPEHHHKSDLDCEPVCCEESCSFFLLA